MTLKIIFVLVAGILSGRFILPQSFYQNTGVMLDVGLCCLLFFVGLDIGSNKETFKNLKSAGLKVMIVPFAAIAGSLFGGIICSFIFNMNIFGALSIASGLSWYTLAPIIITKHSAELGAIAFLANVFREILAFISIPLIAKNIGYLETIAVGGAISMDTGLPIITRNTSQEVVIISFISGVIMSLAVPLLVPVFIGLYK